MTETHHFADQVVHLLVELQVQTPKLLRRRTLNRDIEMCSENPCLLLPYEGHSINQNIRLKIKEKQNLKQIHRKIV